MKRIFFGLAILGLFGIAVAQRRAPSEPPQRFASRGTRIAREHSRC